MAKATLLAKEETKTGSTPAQEIQDKIFKQMSADEKVKLGSELWKLAKDLVGDKINYGKNRSALSSDTHYRHSR